MNLQIAYWDEDHENPPRLLNVPDLITPGNIDGSIFHAALHLDCDHHNEWSDKFRAESMESAFSHWITTTFLGNAIGVGQRSAMDFTNRIIIIGPCPMDIFTAAMDDYNDIIGTIECTDQDGRCEAFLAATIMAITRHVAQNN